MQNLQMANHTPSSMAPGPGGSRDQLQNATCKRMIKKKIQDLEQAALPVKGAKGGGELGVGWGKGVEDPRSGGPSSRDGM